MGLRANTHMSHVLPEAVQEDHHDDQLSRDAVKKALQQAFNLGTSALQVMDRVKYLWVYM
jgi:hypothetical protein